MSRIVLNANMATAAVRDMGGDLENISTALRVFQGHAQTAFEQSGVTWIESLNKGLETTLDQIGQLDKALTEVDTSLRA